LGPIRPGLGRLGRGLPRVVLGTGLKRRDLGLVGLALVPDQFSSAGIVQIFDDLLYFIVKAKIVAVRFLVRLGLGRVLPVIIIVGRHDRSPKTKKP
jgi:hypothetical protein